MSRPLSVAIAVDARQAQAGVKDLSAALDDSADALDDLARDAQRSADRTEKALEDTGDAGTAAAREIERGTERVERSFRDMVRDAGRAEKAVEKVGDGARKGMGDAGRFTGEFRDEAVANFSEVASSFDGSMSSIQDLIQGTLGGLAGVGGAVTLAAGGAAAAVGLIGQALDGNAVSEEAAAERAASWADAYIASADRIISASHIVAEVQAIATGERFVEAGKNAKDWGVDVSTAMRAMAGDGTALAVVQQTLNDRSAESARQLAEQERNATSAAGAVYDLADSVERGQAAYAQLNTDMTEGRARAEAASEALLGIVESAKGATVQTDELGNQLVTLPGDVQVVIDAETGQATQDLDRFKGDAATIPATVPVRVEVAVDDSAWRNWRPTTKRGGVQAYRIGGNVASWED